MKKAHLLILIILCLGWYANGQVNTNIVFIAGAGNTNDNTKFVWCSSGAHADSYTNAAGITMSYQPAFGRWALDTGYVTTNQFPYVWYDIGLGGWPPPDPTGMYAGQTGSAAPVWNAEMTNFWIVPGDFVAFQVSGRNMATTNNPAAIEVVLDTNIVYQSTITAGNGAQFTLDGRLEWDGTNINYFAEMVSGDPANPQAAAFGQITNDTVGTNGFQIVPVFNTNGFMILSASLSASRAPQGSLAPSGTNQLGVGSVTFKTN